MIDFQNSAELIRFLQESELTEEMKQKLIPIAQVATDDDKKMIYEKVVAYNVEKRRLQEERQKLLEQREKLLQQEHSLSLQQ
ncbi:hypothetical protein IPN35_00775 [Candidatus Peregrinibacteria bacterium]|nr:MAG: hypothetical protein IPN35_00775 [Candidatus Peregrinibacteria bacterium]